MKQRPRRAEREVASLLSESFHLLGLSPVFRIPVLGRTGPDLTINEFGLVIDVKSRLEVPVSCIADCLLGFSDFGSAAKDYLIAAPLDRLAELAHDYYPVLYHSPRKTVEDYYAHMKEWVDREYPSGIAAIVLHRPKLPFGKAMLVISNHDRQEFAKRWKTPQSLHSSLPKALFSIQP